MDNPKYMKQNYKLQSSKSKTRTIGINTEENYSKCQCHTSDDICPKFILVPCLPYYYPICTNNINNNCCPPNLNINPNILNQYQFVHNGNENMRHINKCEKHSAINLLHCCSSSNCTTCTNSSCANNQKINTTEANRSSIPVKKNSRENGFRKSSQDKINSTINEKHQTSESCANNSYYETKNENMKQFCDEEMTRYATELLDSQNYKMVQEYEQSKTVNNERICNEEKKIMNNLLTPTQSKFSNPMVNTIEDSDECLEDTENEDETSSIEEVHTVIAIKANPDEEERNRPSTTDGRMRHPFNQFKNFNKPNTGKSSDLEMLMMLKAFVNQSADNDMNPKLNHLINHLSSQDTQIDSKKSLIPRESRK